MKVMCGHKNADKHLLKIPHPLLSTHFLEVASVKFHMYSFMHVLYMYNIHGVYKHINAIICMLHMCI